MNNTSKAIGKLQAIRKAGGFSQAELAKAADVKLQVLQQYESGVRDINGAKLATLLKLCNTLGCKLSDILTDTETLKHLQAYQSK